MSEYRFSSLTFYKDSEILPEKNFFVEGIEDYLSSFNENQKIVINEFQYLRISLSLDIKIHRNEESTSYLANNNFNYLKVNQDGKNYYFFVINKTQVAEETIALSLQLDTINTLRWNSDFSVSSRTKVLREHKDRYQVKNRLAPNSAEFTASSEIESASKDIILQDPEMNEFTKEQVNYINAHLIGIEFNAYDLTTSTILVKGTDFNYTDVKFWNDELSTGENFITISDFSVDASLVSHNIEFYFVVRWNEEVKNYAPLVDFYSEGLSPVLYKEEINELVSPENNHWYLIYKNNENATPGEEVVECYLAPKDTITAIIEDEGLINYTLLEANYYYTFASPMYNFNDEMIISFTDSNNQEITYSTSSTLVNDIMTLKAFSLSKNNNNKVVVQLITYTWNRRLGTWNHTITATYVVDSVKIKSKYYTSYQCLKMDSLPNEIYEGYVNYEFPPTTPVDQELSSIESFDKTLSTLLKIIAIPYLPTSSEFNNEKIKFDGKWEYSQTYKIMKLKDLNTKFNNLVETESSSPYTPLNREWRVSPSNIKFQDRLNKDSKLFHSDFYQPKFVYDSFGFIFQLEKLNQALDYPSKFSFNFVMTTTIRSRFMFKFEDYNMLYATEDYEKILSVARNNEAVIYNSSYITYLRTGYNIDIKAKERTQFTATLGGIFGGIGAVAGTGLSVASGNPALMVKGVISGVSSFASSIVNAVNTIKDSEESMEKNLATLKAQAVSVEGSDDLDLLENYSNNRAKFVIYKVSPRMEKALDDLFYYTGYVANEMKIPEVNSRIWFNFLSCEIVFNAISSNIPQLLKEDLINKYKEGVIFLHEREVESVDTWNFALDKENWETSLWDLVY